VFRVTVFAVLLIAMAVRCLAARGDLWLDEIWSLHFAGSVSSFWHILTRIHHDNNHLLNTWVLYLLGDQEHLVVYRLPSVAVSIASVGVAGVIARRWGRAEALVAVVLTGSSFLLIHYGTEARGYALAVVLTLLAYYLMERYLGGCRWAGLLSGPVAVLGILAHLTFVHAYLALLVWSVVRFIQMRGTWLGLAGRLAWCHVLPICAAAVLYVVHIRHLQIGGGPVFSVAAVVVRAAALALGAPEGGWAAGVAAGLVLALTAVGVRILLKQRCDSAVFFLVAIVISPAVLLLVFPPLHLYARYFLVSVVCFLLLLSRVLARVYRWGAAGRVVCCMVLAGLVAGNARYTTDLLRLGRGQYRAALTYMAGGTAGGVVRVGSDHDFRNGTLIEFYAPRLSSTKRIKYYRQDAWPAQGPEWIIAHSWILSINPPLTLTDAHGRVYTLRGTFCYARLSGWHWFIYQRQ
jgi:hypothetical protein